MSWLFEPIMLCSLRHFSASDKLATVYCGKAKDTVAELTKDRSSELSALSKQQFAALQKATFLGMTIEETVEYDNRHARIGEICREIDKFKATN